MSIKKTFLSLILASTIFTNASSLSFQKKQYYQHRREVAHFIAFVGVCALTVWGFYKKQAQQHPCLTKIPSSLF